MSSPETLSRAFDETLNVLATLTAVEVEPDELATVKALLESDAVYQRETVQGLARKLGYYEAAGGGIEQEARYYEAISQVTPASLRQIAAKYLTFDCAVVTGLLPEGRDLQRGRRARRPHPRTSQPANLGARAQAAALGAHSARRAR